MSLKSIASAIFFLAAAAWLSGAAPSPAAAEGTGSDAESLLGKETLAAVRLARDFAHAGTDMQATLLAKIAEQLRERRLLLAQIVEKNPGAMHRLALPRHLADIFPEEARTEIEQHADLEGTLQVIFEEYGDHHLLRHYLISNGRRLPLYFVGAPPDVMSGTRVRAHGMVFGTAAASSEATAMVVDVGATGVELLAAGGTATTSGGTPIPANTFGEQRTAVLLVNFPANPAQPWTVEQARTYVFGTPSDFIRENSSGQTWLSGDVFGWFTIPVDIATCDTSSISWQAQVAAKNAGIDLTQYSKYIYAFPDIGCAWSGLASVGGNPAEAWFDGTLATSGVVAHEIGHTYGLAHSHALEGGAQSFPTNGTAIDYGDVLDTMGSTSAGHFNAFQKQRLGWLDYGSSPMITHVTTSGSYTIKPYAAAGSGPRALQIPQGTDASGLPVSFYLEYRQPTGFDSFLTGSPYAANVLNGVVLHAGTEGDYQSSYLLDMTPQSQTSDWNDPALTVGKSYYDPASGITITTQSVGSSGATVNVTFAAPQCVTATPAMAITPGQGAWVAAGSTVPFTVSVTNTDSSACSSATFALSSLLPSGWTGTFTQPTLTLAPGTTGTATLSVTSPAAATDGYYNLTATSAENGTGKSGSAAATYVVSNTAVNHPPVAVADTATTAVGTAVTISVLANDSDPDGDPLKLLSTTRATSGKVIINSNGTVSYTPNSRFKGTDQFTYTISDGNASATATVTVTVASPTKKGR